MGVRDRKRLCASCQLPQSDSIHGFSILQVYKKKVSTLTACFFCVALLSPPLFPPFSRGFYIIVWLSSLRQERVNLTTSAARMAFFHLPEWSMCNIYFIGIPLPARWIVSSHVIIFGAVRGHRCHSGSTTLWRDTGRGLNVWSGKPWSTYERRADKNILHFFYLNRSKKKSRQDALKWYIKLCSVNTNSVTHCTEYKNTQQDPSGCPLSLLDNSLSRGLVWTTKMSKVHEAICGSRNIYLLLQQSENILSDNSEILHVKGKKCEAFFLLRWIYASVKETFSFLAWKNQPVGSEKCFYDFKTTILVTRTCFLTVRLSYFWKTLLIFVFSGQKPSAAVKI